MAGAGVTLEELKKRLAEFAKERDWDQYHSPRNLLLAMVSLCLLIVFISMLFCISVLEVGEVGELSEIFQWKGEVPRGLPNWKDEEKEHLGEELSDVLLYLVRLSDICGVDLGKAAMRKLELNAIKYPIKPCEGSSEKHTQINAASHNNANGDGVAGSIYSDNSTSNSGV
ncbi:hypothetical protein POTOM_047111 [Populus tomentosa]|uniref:dCTP pyrophosphatase 1 n=1 Tax=Populus tomentosa TaxID=118781 RepID=A0A8X7YKB9_POPTO|nr:hypothetical protein POTOM_047111 [Populus tomentosa]